VVLFVGAGLMVVIDGEWNGVDDELAKRKGDVEEEGVTNEATRNTQEPKEALRVNSIHLDMRVNYDCTIDVTETVNVTIAPGGETRYSRRFGGEGTGGPDGKGWSEHGIPNWFTMRRFTIENLVGENDGEAIETHTHEYDDRHDVITICAEAPPSDSKRDHTFTLKYTSTGNFMRHYIWFLNRHHRLEFHGIFNNYSPPIEQASIRVAFPEGTRIPDSIRTMGAGVSIVHESPSTILFESKEPMPEGERLGFDLAFSKWGFSYFLVWMDIIFIPLYCMAYFAVTESAKALYRRFRPKKEESLSATE
jgi:hypothetical protein